MVYWFTCYRITNYEESFRNSSFVIVVYACYVFYESNYYNVIRALFYFVFRRVKA